MALSGRVDLLWLGPDPPEWPLGRARSTVATPAGLAEALAPSSEPPAAWVCREPALGPLDPGVVERFLAGPADVGHAGLLLGQRGRPRLMDFVHPANMLNLDAPGDVEASSWRLSFGSCVVRHEVVRRLGGPDPAFDTLDGAALEAGHRWIRHGALVRHVPDLAPAGERSSIPLPIEDEVRFLRRRFGGRWTRWALLRAVGTGTLGAGAALRGWRRRGGPGISAREALRPEGFAGEAPANARVTVLVPTVDRYPYLRVLLDQLRAQTIPPHEVIVVDQTPSERRESGLEMEFPDLPLRVLVLPEPGQCTSRNAGLAVAEGDYVLFLDDDDEIEPSLIEDHLRTLEGMRVDVSSGVALEVGAGPLPGGFATLRTSDVFPTNNSMIRGAVLARSGLFDLAYDRGQRADGDLGRRIHLSGGLMVLNPAIEVLHHRAPRGGLRTHGARVDTYAASRRGLLDRNLPTVSDLYLARRYGTPRQVREVMAMGALGTFSVRGPVWRKALKAGLAAIRLPETMWRIRRRARDAERLLRTHPTIPPGDRFAGRGGP